MNILITTLGSYGDVYPKVGLAIELKKRGHRVTLFTNPFYEGLARKYNLNFAPIGTSEQYDQFANHPLLFVPRRSASVFFDTLLVPGIRRGYESLIRHIQTSDTVIVSSITVFAARLVQEKHHISNVTLHLAPLALKSAYEVPRNAILNFPNWFPVNLKRFYWWVADKAIIDRMICPELNAFRKELGLPAVSRVMTRWGHSPEMVIGLFPAWYAAPQPDWPPKTRLTGFPLFDEDGEIELSVDVKTFVEEGEPPIIFMPGSLMQQAGDFFEKAILSCQEMYR